MIHAKDVPASSPDQVYFTRIASIVAINRFESSETSCHVMSFPFYFQRVFRLLDPELSASGSGPRPYVRSDNASQANAERDWVSRLMIPSRRTAIVICPRAMVI